MIPDTFILAMPGGMEWLLVFGATMPLMAIPGAIILVLILNGRERRRRQEVLNRMGLGGK